jgi:hypothetical protein
MWAQVAKLTLIVGPIVGLLVCLVSHGAPDPFPGAKRRWRILNIGSWAVGLTGMMAVVALLEGYYHPIKADLETNRIYDYNLHGKTIYLTKEEDSALHFFEMISLTGVLGGFVSFYFMQKQQ